MAISIYPNPGQGSFSIKLNGDGLKEAVVSITDMKGRMQWNKKYDIANASSINVPLDIEGLVKGVYLVRVQRGKETIVQKLIVR